MRDERKTKQRLIEELQAARQRIAVAETTPAELERVEAALQESEARFRSAFEKANHGMCLVSRSGQFLEVNSKMTEIYGYSGEELRGKTVNDITHPDDLHVSPAFIERSAAGETESAVFEKRYFHKEGHLLWCEVSSAIVRGVEGGPAHFISHVRDITLQKKAELALAAHERELEEAVRLRTAELEEANRELRETMEVRAQAEEKLRRTEESFRTVADFTHDWETWMAPQGEFLYVSPSCERITGFAVTDFLSDPELMSRIIHRDDLDSWEKHKHGQFDQPGRRDSPAMELRIQHRDGSTRWIEHKCQPVLNDAGDFLGIRGSNRDITRRKGIEAESRAAREELAYVSRVATVGELTASLSHEISQPLTAILTNARAATIFLERDPPDMDEVGAALGGVTAAVERASEVVRHLRSQLRRGEIAMEPLDVGEIVTSTVELLRSESLAAQAEILVDLPAELPGVLGDRVQFQQVLVNLMLNAFEAMQATAPGERRLRIMTRSSGGSVKIEMCDSGSGIDATVLDQVLEPFVTTKELGLGIGLSISRSIVEAHGGRLRVKNLPGGGASAEVTIPVASGGPT